MVISEPQSHARGLKRKRRRKDGSAGRKDEETKERIVGGYRERARQRKGVKATEKGQREGERARETRREKRRREREW